MSTISIPDFDLELIDTESKDLLLTNRIPNLSNECNINNVDIYYSQLPSSTSKHSIISLIYIPNKTQIHINLFNQQRFDILEKDYKIFWINEHVMNSFINDIVNTTGKFVYPMIFVNFIKLSLNVQTKIKLDNTFLFHLRIWSNQIRNLYQSQPKHKRIYTPIIKLYSYNLCCEILYNYKYSK